MELTSTIQLNKTAYRHDGPRMGHPADDLSCAIAVSALGKDLSPSQAATLSQKMTVRRLDPGERLIDASDRPFSLYLVLSGDLKIYGLFGDVVNVLWPGDVVGEVAFFDQGDRTAQIVAERPSTVAEFSIRGFEECLETESELAAKLLVNLSRSLARKLRAAQRLIDCCDAVGSPAKA